MNWLRFGTLSVGALTTTLLLGLIMVYLLSRRHKPLDACFLTGYIAVIFILTLSYTIRYAVFSPLSLSTGQVSNLIVFGVAALIQFSYHYGGCRFPRESKIVLIISLVTGAGLWGSLFFVEDLAAVYDFEAQYFTYQFGPRIGIFTLPGFIWASSVFFRNSRAAGNEKKERDARSNRNFALLTPHYRYTAAFLSAVSVKRHFAQPL